MSRTRLEWAQWMAQKGIGAFVCSPGSKRPLEGRSWYLRQTTEPDTLAKWFDETPDCNYGLHLGAEYVVIDLDRKPEHNGVAAFEDICRENGVEDFTLEIDTLMVRTPGGGWHIYFKAPHPCSNKNLFPDGIDVRGIQGYVVGPGSQDSRGEWEVVDTTADIAPLPLWLEEYVVEPGYKDPNRNVPVIDLDLPENVQHAKEWLAERDPAIEGKNGDDWTYQTILYLRDFGISEGMVAEVMQEWNSRCVPPWDGDELEAKVRNSYEYGQNRPGIKSPTYKVQQVIKGHGAGAGLTQEQIAELFHPTDHLTLVVDNTAPEDDDIPDDVPDDELDPEVGGKPRAESIFQPWSAFTYAPAVREYVVYEWVLAHGVSHMVASRGTGKSTLALNLACHVACDMDWAGQRTQKGWKVIYICGEDDVGMRLNARAWVEEYGAEPTDDRFMWAQDVIKLNDLARLKLRVAEMVKWAAGARTLVVLDTWQRATSGWGKNDAEAMEEAVERAEFIARHMNGPLLSLVHPPKDGRMTVKGAGEQEDTSTGIYHVEKVSDGVRMKIERIKGPGHGRYLTFHLKPVDLLGVDTFGETLNGIVACKVGGSEEESAVEALDRKARELLGWGEAIRGMTVFSNEPNEWEPVTLDKLNIAFVSRWLGDMSVKIQEKDEDALSYGERFLEELLRHIDGGVKNLSRHIAAKRLKELFDGKNPPEVRASHWTMTFQPKRTGGKHKLFMFEDRTI